MFRWPRLVEALRGLLQTVQSTHIQLVAFHIHLDVDVLRHLGQLSDSFDLSSIHEVQEGEPLVHTKELRIHVFVEPCGSPPMPSREISPSADGLVEMTMLAGLRRVFAPFHSRGALHITKTIC